MPLRDRRHLFIRVFALDDAPVASRIVRLLKKGRAAHASSRDSWPLRPPLSQERIDMSALQSPARRSPLRPLVLDRDGRSPQLRLVAVIASDDVSPALKFAMPRDLGIFRARFRIPDTELLRDP